MSQIPRGSGNEKGISDYIVNFAHNLGLEATQDSEWNVVIKKPATPGYENRPAVILQGHIDMVCVKGHDSSHDFTKDPSPTSSKVNGCTPMTLHWVQIMAWAAL